MGFFFVLALALFRCILSAQNSSGTLSAPNTQIKVNGKLLVRLKLVNGFTEKTWLGRRGAAADVIVVYFFIPKQKQ